MRDILDERKINSLGYPIYFVDFNGRLSWPILDICIQTGCARIDVIGLVECVFVSDFKSIANECGSNIDVDDLYLDDVEE